MKVSLVGAGPGDPGLLTLRGREILEQADAIIYDALANPDLLKFARPEAELVYVGKIADQHSMPQAEINRLLVEKAREKGNVARLKGGDPYIFGRGGEEAEYLAENGIPFEEVPGISSAIAAPAYAGIPLTHRDFVSSVTVIAGHEKPEKKESAHNWRAFVESGATLVFVMGMKNLPHICASLIEAGMNPDMPAAVIYRGTTPAQKTVAASLADLPEAARGLANPAVIVVGKVVGLGDRLDWFSRKPLFGRNVVVTRAREQASDLVGLLKNLGANALECPSIKIGPLEDYALRDAAISRLAEYRWLVFTSVNGVKYFWQGLAKAGKDARALAGAKIAAIGPATAKALRDRGIEPDLVPQTYVAEAVAEAMIQADALGGARVLLPRAAKARPALPDALAKAGAAVDIVPLYETAPARDGGGEVAKLLEAGRLDCAAFGSSSTVENFLKIIPAEKLAAHPETRLAAIGPITAGTLREHGLKADIQPEQFTIPALAQAIAAAFSRKEK